MKIYFPMSARVLTPGHIKCIEYLLKQGEVIVGLLTKRAMKGYKDEIVPYKDREFILKSLKFDIKVVRQTSLDPIENIKKYKCNAIASGDGWERQELEAMAKTKLTAINITLPGEEEKKYSSSKILKL